MFCEAETGLVYLEFIEFNVMGFELIKLIERNCVLFRIVNITPIPNCKTNIPFVGQQACSGHNIPTLSSWFMCSNC